MKQTNIHRGLEYLLARIIQDFMGFMQQTGLSRYQIHALMHIYHAGECAIAEIGALSEASPAAASQLVERLVQQGLVERREDPQNRRIKKLSLTEQGLALIRQGVTGNHFLAELMATLPANQRETVHTALGYLAQASEQIHDFQEGRDKAHASNA
jgi:DNA-binding MarR family transcriptional regulator